MIATNPTHQEIMIFSQNRRKHALSLVLIKVHKGNHFYSACTVEYKLKPFIDEIANKFKVLLASF